MAGPINLAKHPPKKAKKRPAAQNEMPSREQVMAFIETSKGSAGKREIARAFGLKGQEKIALKALLRDMTDEGLVDLAPGRAFHKMGGLPRVTVLKIVEIDGNQPIAVPERWEADGIALPKLRVIEKGRRGALGVGDRILARTEEAGNGWLAHPVKKLGKASEQILGVVEAAGNGRFWLKSTDKKMRYDTPINSLGDAKAGDLVLAETTGGARKSAKITEVLGDTFAPKSFSMIAIHKYGIPDVFSEEVEAEAAAVSKLPITADQREDLRHLPIIAIDPRDARDFDDAIWAAPDDDAGNPGGYRAIICIADVSYYVRPGSALDKEAVRRGNSVYFPDLVVPMLPHSLSSDKCSLRQGEDRAVMACHLVIDKNGKVTSWRFTRAVARIAANIAYEDAQAAVDGKLPHEMLEPALKPLWACWKLLFKARQNREPLAIDMPERRITLDEKGRVTGVAVRETLDANRLVEDFMIAANVAAAKALEAKKSPLIYRAHEEPSREKLIALKDYLKSYDISFAMGQVIKPSTFNTILRKIEKDDEIRPQIMESVLRSQTQAYYSPLNMGHFGLALTSYAHFTSPIRRYADLIVHRALVGAYNLEMPKPKDKAIKPETALSKAEITKLSAISEAISRTERRAMEAERETTDRYVAAYLAQYVGEIVETRITGVQNFGFFATVEGIGGDGLVPVSTLGSDYFIYQEASQSLIGERTGQEYRPGMKIKLRLVEANPVSGALRFSVPSASGGGGYKPDDSGPEGDKENRKATHSPDKTGSNGNKPKKYKVNRRGRPANIRHKGRKA
ncbi:ribonuclease R [Sphingorhabdus arenilitoris]|uniref:Ribonuclease R n=1 Tax=Sphingorhabdus arenilitoris TaxID=1490041 RepID=A0ABV8RGW0_9SPHN